jgi:hypothetical protein
MPRGGIALPQESLLGRWQSEEAMTALSGRFGNARHRWLRAVNPFSRFGRQLRN